MNKTLFALLPLTLAMACGGAEGGSPTSSSSEVTPSPETPLSVEDLKADAAPPPPIDAGGPKCWGEATGKMPCANDFELFKQARESCTSGGGYVHSFIADESCGAGSSGSYSVTCCDTKPTCAGGGMGSSTCTADNSLFTSAEESCKGGAISTFRVDPGKCTGHTAESADFSCACK